MTAVVALAFAGTTAQVAFAQGYGGPSMLSRGGNRPGQRGRAPVDFVGYGAIRGTVETGLTPVRLDDDGTVAQDELYGVQAELGLYGTHSWKKTVLGMDYRGDYRRTSLAAYNGTNQAISLDLMHTVNRRVSLFFRESGGTTNRAFGGFAAPATADLNSLNLVNNEVFDTRLYFSQTSAGVSYRTSARTSYTVMGDGFFTKRPDVRLVSVTGYRGAAAMEYRLSSRSSVGGAYQYSVYDYPRAFGHAEMHGAVLTLSRRITRNVDVNLTAGAMRLLATGTEVVELSPEVAAILGRTTGVEAFERTNWLPQIAGTLGYALERSRLTVAFSTGMTPGNGVYLTSQLDSVSAGYSFTGIRKLSLGASARYSEMKSKALSIESLRTVGGGGGLNYALTRIVNLSTQFDYRTFRTQGIPGRKGYFLSVGLSVSPSRIPLSIW